MLTAIESRDLRLVHAAFSSAATWQNVPHPAAVGTDAVLEMLAGILTWSDDVRWEVVSASYGDGVAWVERIDRFRIAGEVHAVSCNGVVHVDVTAGVVTSVRDYVDLGEWRARILPVYERMCARSPDDVIARHLAAVERRDRVAMAADYALDAELARGGDRYRGWREIADYFDTVPARLGDHRLSFGSIESTTPSGAAIPWQITSGTRVVASGRDDYRVERGRIAHQTVTLDLADF
jgi:limonene-1,2-epoxide hydrolase